MILGTWDAAYKWKIIMTVTWARLHNAAFYLPHARETYPEGPGKSIQSL